ncbi:MAG: endonuclease/exonuclease/phosphatase family metal-dependent hydrolase [Gammaproteobacteria bacterium]|jgi:endonuclease/exonuclease/phosphatase family metal-dependent hydrolase
MRILSWNVQSGKSCDGSSDFSRTLEYVKSLGEFDVICLQELARNMIEYCAPGQSDQLQMTQQFFQEHHAIWGSGFSWPLDDTNPEVRQEFGNITLVKSGLLDYRVHSLPRPATPGKVQMQRVSVETVIDSKIGGVSIINSHLAFHDENENRQQVERLNWLEQERFANQIDPKQIGIGTYQEGFPATARILCGDFNFTPDKSQYRHQLDMNWVDAWQMCNGEAKHLPTCGIFDPVQWPQGGHCRDFFWLSRELKFVGVDISVDIETNLSDHQPVILEISI